MSNEWRGDPREQTAMQKFFRCRWRYGSVYVLDIDHVICRPDGSLGLLIEEKLASATDRTATITRKIARGLGWWAALFVYHTDDGTKYGTVTRIDADVWGTDGVHVGHFENMTFDSFDQWICEEFAAEAAA